MKNNIKYFWITTITILFFSTGIKAQLSPTAATNKQAKKEIKSEQKRGREKQSIEDNRSKKSSDKINAKAKYNKVDKKKKKKEEKKIR
jgi:hypothetical protein